MCEEVRVRYTCMGEGWGRVRYVRKCTDEERGSVWENEERVW